MQSNFRNLISVLSKVRHPVTGNLLLGDRSTLTAADICNEFDEATIIDLLRTYGDEPRAKRIAAAIVADRPLYTTTDLVHAINTCTPTFARQKRAGLIATSARVFQALRIVVNEEDGALKDVLEGVAPWALA